MRVRALLILLLFSLSFSESLVESSGDDSAAAKRRSDETKSEHTQQERDSLNQRSKDASIRADSARVVMDSSQAHVDSTHSRVQALRKEANKLQKEADSTRAKVDSSKAVADSSAHIVDSIAVELGADSSLLDTVEQINELDTLTDETIDSLRTDLEEAVVGIDSVYLKNGDIITGELKKLNKNVLTVETDYSDKDLKIEWENVERVVGGRVMYFVDKEGVDYYGTMSAIPDSGYRIRTLKGREVLIAEENLITLEQGNTIFKDRFSANIDLGYSIKKAHNENQFNGHSKMGFNTNRLRIDFRYDGFFTIQDSVSKTQRHEWSLSSHYLLPTNWYLTAAVSWLNSTESKLQLRSVGRGGVGKFLIRTNQFYLSADLGLGGTRDLNYPPNDSTPAVDPNSEFVGYIGFVFDVFDLGDLDLYIGPTYYVNISDGPRHRIEGKVDFTYELPLDFYIRIGFIFNYDSKPAAGADEADYQLTFGAGWEF